MQQILTKWLLFTIAFSTLFAPTSVSAAFGDVPKFYAYYNAINYVHSNKIAVGYADGKFRPDKRINKVELLKMAVESRYDRSTIDNCVKNNVSADSSYVYFPDVPKVTWFAKYVCVGKYYGLVADRSETMFNPAQQVSYGEASMAFVRGYNYKVPADAVTIEPFEDWYTPYVYKMDQLKIRPPSVNGHPVYLTRGEVAEMIYRLNK